MDKGCKTCAHAGTLTYKSPCSGCVESGTFIRWKARTCVSCEYGTMPCSKEPCHSCFGVKGKPNWKRCTTDADLKAKDEQTAEAKADNVNRPAHYTECSLECIDVMLAVFGRRAVTDFCIINAFKYMWRYEHKNGLEDLKKAERYLAMATTFQTGDTEHEIRIIYMQEELEILMRRANE